MSRHADDRTEVLSLDSIFGALSNSRRRHALQQLRQSDRPVALDDLARRVAALETSPDEPSSERRRQVRTALYHRDVPQLEALGVVERPADAEALQPTARAEQLEAYLDLAASHPTSPFSER